MKKFLLGVARIKIAGTFIGFIFTYCPFIIPLKKLMINKKFVAVAHPSPSYPDHALIIPRKIARSVFELTGEDFTGAIDAAKKIRRDDNDFTLIINGGKKQDVMQAHFHFFTGGFIGNINPEVEIKKLGAAPELFYSEHFASGLRVLLNSAGVSGESFSICVQFDSNSGRGTAYAL